jgi:S-DNA-T family DNA segregation ATPase FtsK/SpoIIIE
MVRTLAAQLAGAYAPTDLHVFVLDGAGALATLVELPHCGAVVGRDETARADRLVSRLAEEVERRHHLLAANGHASLGEQRRSAPAADRLPWLVLLVDGWERIAAAYDVVDHGRPLEILLRLVREGAAVGLRVVVTGDRSLLLGRAASLFGERLLLRFADPADYALAGISPHQLPTAMPPGRALLPPDATEVQLATIARDATGAGQRRAFDRAVAGARSRWSATPDRPDLLPMRVEPLPARVDLVDVEAAAKAVAPSDGWALLGVGGDENAPVGVDLERDGPAFLIAGGPGSGRTTTVATMGRWLAGRGRPVLVVAHHRSPLRSLAGEPGVLAVLSPADALALDRLLLDRPEAVVLADDAETLHDAPVEQSLLGLLRPDADRGGGLVLAGSAADMACCFRGLTVEARRARTGLLLGPAGPADGDLLGVRVYGAGRGEPSPTGRGLLVVRGRATPVQVAHTPL